MINYVFIFSLSKYILFTITSGKNGSNIAVTELALFLSCLSSLSVRNEYCQQASEKNGLTILFELLVDPDQKPQIVKESLLLLKTLAGNDNVKNDYGVGIKNNFSSHGELYSFWSFRFINAVMLYLV